MIDCIISRPWSSKKLLFQDTSDSSSNARTRTGAQRQLAIVNLSENEKDLVKKLTASNSARPSPSHARKVSATAGVPARSSSAVAVSGTTPRKTGWANAEEEKLRLYEAAVANVERVQGRPVRPRSPSQVRRISDPVRVLSFLTYGSDSNLQANRNHPPRSPIVHLNRKVHPRRCHHHGRQQSTRS